MGGLKGFAGRVAAVTNHATFWIAMHCALGFDNLHHGLCSSRMEAMPSWQLRHPSAVMA
jgi:hypothetical protein